MRRTAFHETGHWERENDVLGLLSVRISSFTCFNYIFIIKDEGTRQYSKFGLSKTS